MDNSQVQLVETNNYSIDELENLDINSDFLDVIQTTSLISKVNKVEKKELVNIDFPTIPKFDHLDQNVNEKKISSFL